MGRMALIQIDDKLYLRAQQYIWSLGEGKDGISETFENWIRDADSGFDSGRWKDLGYTFAGLTGHYSGDYEADAPWNDDKLVVWSFFRAWADRDAVPH
jgi:hypothetical protein